MAASMGMCVRAKSSYILTNFFRSRGLKHVESDKKAISHFICSGNLPFLPLCNGIVSRLYSSTIPGSSESDKPGSITEKVICKKIVIESEEEKNNEKKEKSKDSEKEQKSSRWTGKNAWKAGLLFLGGGTLISGGIIIHEWGSPRIDKDGNVVEDELSILPTWQQYPKRAWREFNFYKQMIRDPSSEKLLPDPLREPYYQPPYTLVLEMTGVLVHPDWTYGTGWRFKKRPGVDYFLQQVGPPLFEVVIYTKEQGFTASPILDSLDPNGYITYRLYKDATRYINGSHVKDIDCLNRDPSKVIIVDCDAKAFQLQPRNAIPMKKWKGEDEDRNLLDLASLLRTIAASNIDDVRTVLDHYNQFNEPLEVFRENQRRWQEEQEKLDNEKLQQQNKPLVKSYAPGFFRRR